MLSMVFFCNYYCSPGVEDFFSLIFFRFSSLTENGNGSYSPTDFGPFILDQTVPEYVGWDWAQF